jgi:hypothetical protein
MRKMQAEAPTSLNDMNLICAECNCKSECRRSQETETIARDHPAFCNNAELLREAERRYRLTAA